MASIGVAVLHNDPTVLEDLAYAIERCEGIHCAALGEVRDAAVVVASPDSLPNVSGIGVVVLSTGDVLADARAGFAAGARGMLRWPDDGPAALPGVIAAACLGVADAPGRGKVISVRSARGGAGSTTVACLLAAALEGSILVDLSGGDQLAFTRDGGGGSLEAAAAVPLPDVIGSTCEEHASGRALLPRLNAAALPRGSVEAVLAGAARIAPWVVVDAGGLEQDIDADVTVVICLTDVASVRVARDWLGNHDDTLIVINTMRRSGLRVRHVEKALERAAVAVMPADRRLARSADVGSLPRRQTRKVRGFIRALKAAVE